MSAVYRKTISSQFAPAKLDLSNRLTPKRAAKVSGELISLGFKEGTGPKKNLKEYHDLY